MRRLRITPPAILIILVVLTLIVGGGNLWASRDFLRGYQAGQAKIQAAQKRQGEILEQRLCTTLRRLAALKPPPGSPADNPSRAYLQSEHDVLAELGPDVGCPAR